MPKLEITTTAAITVKLKPTAKAMVKARCEEHGKLAKAISDAKARQTRIKDEVDEIFRKEKQGKALLDGVEIDGHKIKVVQGHTSKLDKKKLVELGCEQEWLDEATEKVPNSPYVKITAPGEKERE